MAVGEGAGAGWARLGRTVEEGRMAGEGGGVAEVVVHFGDFEAVVGVVVVEAAADVAAALAAGLGVVAPREEENDPGTHRQPVARP